MAIRIGDVGRAAEKRMANDLKARLRPASGAMQGAKGDMTSGKVLIEAKSTVNDSLGLKHAWLAKIAKESRDLGMMPALAVNFTDGTGRPVQNGAWVLIRRSDFVEKFIDAD